MTVRTRRAAVAAEEASRLAVIQRALLEWFSRHRRDLPWRRTRDPFAIWISEVMCQQTQVATVIPYWERFMARFPDVHALAAAPLDDVLTLWSGLGYYARARHLHRAAQAIVSGHEGRLPADLDLLRKLPGFGPYTAGAVASIGLGLDAPLVDGNVARVLCRLQGWEAGAEEARQAAWETAPGLIPPGRAGDWNQALMELGATVCAPAAPRCDACPVRGPCLAVRRGEPAAYPLPKKRPVRTQLRVAALAVRDRSAILLVRRKEKGLFGGLWDLPSVTVNPEQAPRAAARALASSLFARSKSVERLGEVAQALTHRDVVVDVFAVSGSRLRMPDGGRFVTPADLRTLGLSTLAVKTLRAAGIQVPEGHGRRRAPNPAQSSLFEP